MITRTQSKRPAIADLCALLSRKSHLSPHTNHPSTPTPTPPLEARQAGALAAPADEQQPRPPPLPAPVGRPSACPPSCRDLARPPDQSLGIIALELSMNNAVFAIWRRRHIVKRCPQGGSLGFFFSPSPATQGLLAAAVSRERRGGWGAWRPPRRPSPSQTWPRSCSTARRSRPPVRCWARAPPTRAGARRAFRGGMLLRAVRGARIVARGDGGVCAAALAQESAWRHPARARAGRRAGAHAFGFAGALFFFTGASLALT